MKAPKLCNKFSVIDAIRPLDIEVFIGHTTVKEIWEGRDEWTKTMQKGREEWDKLTTEQQAAVIRVLQSGMERLYDTIPEWAADGLELRSGTYLDVHFRLLLTDADEEVEADRLATTFSIRQAIAGTNEMLQDLTGEPQTEAV